MTKRGIISQIGLLFTLLFIVYIQGPAHAKASDLINFDENFLVSRAIVIANFSADEISVQPEIRYLMPGEEIAESTPFNQSERVVNIFDPRFGIGGVQAIFKAPQISVQDSGQTLTFSSFKKTVGDILEENGIVLANEDKVEPAIEQVLSNNTILITRVSVAELIEFKSLPYQTRTIDDPTLERGKKVTKQSGQEGKNKLTYQVRRENGVEVSRELTNESIEVAPQDKIILNGTKIIVLSSLSGEASWTNGVTAMRNYRRGTVIRVTNLANGKSVITTVGGWGPQEWTGRILDLDRSSFDVIADIASGTANVKVEELNE